MAHPRQPSPAALYIKTTPQSRQHFSKALPPLHFTCMDYRIQNILSGKGHMGITEIQHLELHRRVPRIAPRAQEHCTNQIYSKGLFKLFCSISRVWRILQTLATPFYSSISYRTVLECTPELQSIKILPKTMGRRENKHEEHQGYKRYTATGE